MPVVLQRMVLGLVMLLGVATPAQTETNTTDPPPAASDHGLTNLLAKGYFESRQASLSNRTDLAEEVRTEVEGIYRQSLALVSELKRLDAEAARLRETAATASNRLAEINAKLAEPVPAPDLGIETNASLSEIERRISVVRAEYDLAQQTADRLEEEPKRRAERQLEIANELAEKKHSLEDLGTEPAQTSEPAPDVLVAARNDRNRLQREVLSRQIRNLNLELASYSATSDLVRPQQALARRMAANLAKTLELLEAELNRRRTAESQQAAEAAEKARQRAELLGNKTVSALARANKELAAERTRIAADLKRISSELDANKKELRDIQDKFDGVQNRVQAAQEIGVTMNYALGLALRQEQYEMPSRSPYSADSKELARQTIDANYRLLAHAERQRALADLPQVLSQLSTNLSPDLTESDRQTILDECRKLLEEQNDLLADLQQDYETYLGRLRGLSLVENELEQLTQEFQDYVSERVLWMPSADRLGGGVLLGEVGPTFEFLRKECQEHLLPFLRKDFRRQPSTYGIALGLIAILVLGRVFLIKTLARNCPLPGPDGRLAMRPALVALVYTFLLALPVPLLFVFLGWRFTGYPEASPLNEAFAPVCFKMASAVFAFEFFRQICRQPGLAVTYMRWPEHNARLVRRVFLGVMVVGVPVGFIMAILEGVFADNVSNRLPFMIFMLLMMAMGHLILRPNKGLRFRHEREGNIEMGPLPLQRLYHLTALIVPLLLIVASAYGFTYTARQLWMRIGDSIKLGLYVLVVGLLVQHWLAVARRRLALRARAQKQEAQPGETEISEKGHLAYEVAAAKADLAGARITNVIGQSKRLLNTVIWIVVVLGMISIWADMFPALKGLDRIPVWGPRPPESSEPSAAVADAPPPPQGLSPGLPGITTAPAPPSARAGSELAQSTPDFLSWADLLTAIAAVVLTIVASRNLPGFLQLVVLDRFKFTRGEGYAITNILRYTIILLGTGWALHSLGVTWGKVQWLAAAATVGIGFGLQEIFANFVSGLVLLFERPVRVGDVITVGETTGVVTRIHMRATTVRNWDRLELVLPNKELITGRVINWTLSNDVTRLAITVGVSYETDVPRASELMVRIANETPNVLKDPAPFVTFDKFAESNLALVLRCYVPLDARLGTRSALNNGILDAFRREGIEIAYPQHDLHVRSVDEQAAARLPRSPSGPDGS